MKRIDESGVEGRTRRGEGEVERERKKERESERDKKMGWDEVRIKRKTI